MKKNIYQKKRLPEGLNETNRRESRIIFSDINLTNFTQLDISMKQLEEQVVFLSQSQMKLKDENIEQRKIIKKLEDQLKTKIHFNIINPFLLNRFVFEKYTILSLFFLTIGVLSTIKYIYNICKKVIYYPFKKKNI